MSVNNELCEKIKTLRNISLKRRKVDVSLVNKPIAFWIKEDRLLNDVGKGFTIILRTNGCSWSQSETGGCSVCGYINDTSPIPLKPQNIINQFTVAMEQKLNEIENDDVDYIFKIFNSGSFFDKNEIAEEVRHYIYNNIEIIDNVREVVVESRPEYINSLMLKEIKEFFKNKYFEIGVGVETTNDWIRNHYINKGVTLEMLIEAFRLCQTNEIGIKAYLLFKPIFLNEISAIDDCVASITALKDLNINSISVNPLNIQKGTLAEHFWRQNRYRPPWYYSLYDVFKRSILQEDLKELRVLCEPSGVGTTRGIHNCLERDCEMHNKNLLREFVLSQNLDVFDKSDLECSCIKKYDLQKFYS